MARKLALIIRNSQYDDVALARLPGAHSDSRALAEILKSPDIGQFDEVTELADQGVATVRRAIAGFFSGAKRDDLVLFYYFGYGVKDELGNLWFAVKDTDRSQLAATSIEAAFVTGQMDRSISKRQVVILDCSHSGAFALGSKSGGPETVGTAPAFEGRGYGRVVLTTTDSAQYAWEGDQIIGEFESSVFTHHLLKGLKTGEADRDGDGVITIDELFDYVYEHVVAERPNQPPAKWSYKQQGEIVLAVNANRAIGTAELPLEVGALVESPLPRLRAEAVAELANLLRSRHPRLALAARAALARLSTDDSRSVSAAAHEVLAELDVEEQPRFAQPDPITAGEARDSERDQQKLSEDSQPLARQRESQEHAAGKPLYLDDNVQFTVYRPQVIQPAKSYPLLAFAHLSELPPEFADRSFDPVEEVQKQAESVLGTAANNYPPVRHDSRHVVPRGGELTFYPEIAGIEFDPPFSSFLWREPVHKVEFLLKASPGTEGRTVWGRLTVFLGGIILADVGLSIRVEPSHRASAAAVKPAVDLARPYRKIFASYSHQDFAVVEEYDRHARATGDRYLLDVVQLRSGESWHERLMQMIAEADLFQLFWSWNSMTSECVRQECAYALSLDRPYFVRPVYWEEPLPRRAGLPPPALGRLHFQRIYPSAAQPAPPIRDVEATRLAELVRVARHQIETGRFSDALEMLQRAKQIDSTAAEIDQLVAAAGEGQERATEEQRRRREIDEMLAEASRQLDREDVLGAAALADQALQLDPANAGAEMLRTRIREAIDAQREAARREAEARERERHEAEARERKRREAEAREQRERDEAEIRERERREVEIRERQFREAEARREEERQARERERLLADREAAQRRERPAASARVETAPVTEPETAEHALPFPPGRRKSLPQSSVSLSPMRWAGIALLLLMPILFALAFC